MPLSDDQKAMLRLLAQREDGYDEMAALMGIGVEELRRRVKEALAEIDAPEAPRRLRPTRPRSPRARPQLLDKLPKDRGALIGLGAGVLAVLAMAIVLIVSGGGSSSSSPAEAGGTPTAAGDENLTEAVLAPVSDGDASGRALFGRYKQSVLLQVTADGLEPAPAGQAYTVWLYRSPKLSLQLGAVPERDGRIAAQLQIPTQLLAYVASGAFNQVDVSLTPTAAYKAALAKARSERKLPPHIGESVLRGQITGPAIRGQQ